MKNTISTCMLIAALTLPGCGATQGWFRKPTTQSVIAEGCKAAQIDDTTNNAMVNAVIPYPEVRAAINSAHMAIQAALQKCIDDATRDRDAAKVGS